MTLEFVRSAALYEAAKKVIPGGIHLSGRPLLTPETSPLYFERGSGARCTDVDGNEYIDYIMAYGPFLLGYGNEEVNEAAFEQIRRGALLSLNHPLHLKFMERLLSRFPKSQCGVFLKTGSEATTAALRIARKHTKRRKIARCGYHGWHDWCLPLEPFVPHGLSEQVFEFSPRLPGSLEHILERHGEEIAAVIVAPEMVLNPTRDVFAAWMDATAAVGAVFILDEVKTAFRTNTGSIQSLLDLDPDVTTLSKALGNGWPLAAVIGKRHIMESGIGMHYSATFHGETGAIAAALKVLEIVQRDDVAAKVNELGQTLIDGLNGIALGEGLPAVAYAEPVPSMPFLSWQHPDPQLNATLRDGFYARMLEGGILMHPRHLWFTSAAHTRDDIVRTIAVAASAMGAIKQELGHLL